VLETAHRAGRARILDWNHDDRTVRTPALIVPDTTRFPAPDDADVVLSAAPKAVTGVNIVSEGTWFFPNVVPSDSLVVPALQPAPTGHVQTLHIGDDVAVWHDAAGWASNPAKCVPAMLGAADQIGMGKVLWAPGVGRIFDYALWAYLGVDLIDASPLQLAAIRGEVLTTDGALTLADAAEIYGGDWDEDRAWQHNLQAAEAELTKVRQSIRDGNLRALVERRCSVHPSSVALLRRFDQEHKYLEFAAPVVHHAQMACMTVDSLWSPEVEGFRRRLRENYTPPAEADILVILPCSARKPYKLSKSHRYFARSLDDSGVRYRIHEVMVTSPLGLVPRELEDLFPANQYDVPVTGHWSRDEESIIREQLAALLEAHTYDHVVAHVPASTFTFLRDLLPDHTMHTAHGTPQSKDECDRMRNALRDIRDANKKPSSRVEWNERKRQDVLGLASFQFGAEAAAALCEGAHAHGRMPYLKLSNTDGQLAMTTPDRGILSLTLLGARKLAPFGVKQVQIQDFPIRKTGSLFAVGVTSATADVRPGDDVILMHGDDVRACGAAEMSGAEMTAMTRGIAVKMRHITDAAKGKKTEAKMEAN
jgi:archaeosine synthase